MKYKKKEFLIALIIISLIIIILLINLKNFSGNSKTSIIKKPVYNYTPEKKEEIKNEVINNISAITSEETTIDNLKKIVSQKDIVNVFLTTGENSYLRNKPSDEIIEKYNLSSLKEQQEYYVSRVEKKYLDNLKYEVVSEEVGEGSLCENIEITTYYYSLYLNDYINITSSLENEIIDEKKDTKKEQEEKIVKNYKNQIAALKVLDNYLDDYDNFSKEKEEVKICYEDGELKDKDQILTLLIALQGELYSNMDMNNEVVLKKSNERLEKYLKEIEEMQ